MAVNTLVRTLTVLVGGLALAVAQPAATGDVPRDLEALLGAESVTEWSECTVDSTRDVGTYLDVAVSGGVPYVSYYDDANDDLWFARRVGGGGNCGPAGSWSCQLVDATGDSGQYNSIAVWDAGPVIKVTIPYLRDELTLRYASGECDQSGCSFETHGIQFGATGSNWVGRHTSVAYTSNGWPSISYQRITNTNSGSVRVASRRLAGDGNCGFGDVEGQWQCDTIMTSTGLGTYTSIAFDGLGRPHVAFYDPTNGYPYHALETGTGGNCGPDNHWLCRTVNVSGQDLGVSVSVFAEADGTPHLAFRRGPSQVEHLIYATFVGVGGNCGFSGTTSQFEWQCDVIDDDIGPIVAGRAVDIAPDPSGAPMIAYRDASSSTGPAILRFAQPYASAPAGSVPNCGPFVNPLHTWVCTTLDNGGAYLHEGAAVAMASDSAGVAIAYHEEDSYLYRGVLKAMMLDLPMFADGFENGNPDRWTVVVP